MNILNYGSVMLGVLISAIHLAGEACPYLSYKTIPYRYNSLRLSDYNK
nr:MAG TPA: hypothetical protein [Bacteriophage sp.]